MEADLQDHINALAAILDDLNAEARMQTAPRRAGIRSQPRLTRPAVQQTPHAEQQQHNAELDLGYVIIQEIPRAKRRRPGMSPRGQPARPATATGRRGRVYGRAAPAAAPSACKPSKTSASPINAIADANAQKSARQRDQRHPQHGQDDLNGKAMAATIRLRRWCWYYNRTGEAQRYQDADRLAGAHPAAIPPAAGRKRTGRIQSIHKVNP